MMSRLSAGVRFALCVGFLAGVAGCQPENIDSTYGRRRSDPGSTSVNGTQVLARMFENAGHRAITWRRLSPKLNDSQTIVWFPNDFSPPNQEQRQFLENWLEDNPSRTLVYVGRDYDAAIAYWTKIRDIAPPEQAIEVARRLALAQASHDRKRAAMPNDESCNWFVVRRDATRVTSPPLAGPWAEGIDATKCEIEVTGRFDIPDDSQLQKWMTETYSFNQSLPKYEKLLTAKDAIVVGRITRPEWQGGQILFVANGSFLLNLQLINHEHRKLAGKLIEACGSPGRVTFLESSEGGPPVFDKEPGANAPTGFEVFTVWPLGVILVHVTALGILACVTLFPVFGRPRELPARSSADFGQHVEALGELLEKTGDREYAWQRIRTYQDQVRRETTSATK